MASGNRVEELESRVRELEATVSGLTDELVEARERLHAIEDEVDPDMDIIEGKPTRRSTADDVDAAGGAEGDKAPAPEESNDADPEASDDIIVA